MSNISTLIKQMFSPIYAIKQPYLDNLQNARHNAIAAGNWSLTDNPHYTQYILMVNALCSNTHPNISSIVDPWMTIGGPNRPIIGIQMLLGNPSALPWIKKYCEQQPLFDVNYQIKILATNPSTDVLIWLESMLMQQTMHTFLCIAKQLRYNPNPLAQIILKRLGDKWNIIIVAAHVDLSEYQMLPSISDQYSSFANPDIIGLDCDAMKKQCQPLWMELIPYVLHPRRLRYYLDKYGYNISTEEYDDYDDE